MARSGRKTVKQATGASFRTWRGQEVEAAEQQDERRGHPPGSEGARLVARARPALEKALQGFNTITLLANIFLRAAIAYLYAHRLPVPPLTQRTWELAVQCVSAGGEGGLRWDPASERKNPYFCQFYKRVWVPTLRQLRRRRSGFAERQGLVDRRSLHGPLGEWARTQAAHAVNTLTYHNGVQRRIGIYLFDTLLAAVLEADEEAIQSGRISKRTLENFGSKVPGVLTSTAREEGEERDAFLRRLVQGAAAAKPSGLRLPSSVINEWLEDEVRFILSLFTERLLPLVGGKPQHKARLQAVVAHKGLVALGCRPEMQVPIDEYVPPLLALRMCIPEVDGALSFEILPVHGIDGRSMPVAPNGLKLIVFGNLLTDQQLAAAMRRAGVQASQDANAWLFNTIIRPPEKGPTGYELANFVDFDLVSCGVHYVRDEGSILFEDYYEAEDRKEAMLERRQGTYSRAQEQPWPQLGRRRTVVRSRGYDPGQRDIGTAGAEVRRDTTGREQRLDADGMSTNVAISVQEHRSLLCVDDAAEERSAIMKLRPHLQRLQGVLRSSLVTGLASCLQQMKGEIFLAMEARGYFSSGRQVEVPGPLCSRRVATSIPTHVRDPKERMVVLRNGQEVSAQVIMRQTDIRVGDALFPSRGGPTVGMVRYLADNCGSVRMVDEFRSSKLCPKCHTVMRQQQVRLTDEQRRELERRGRKEGKHARAKMYQLWWCPNPRCRTWWQRDVAGGTNLDYLGRLDQSAERRGQPVDKGRFSRDFRPWEGQ